MPEGKLAQTLLQEALVVLEELSANPAGMGAEEFQTQLELARQVLESAALRILPEVVTNPVELTNALKRYSEPQRREVLEHLAKTAPERAQTLRADLLFFADLLSCENALIQKILRQVDWKEVGLALKTASVELQARFFANMSERAAAMVQEEMELMGPSRLTDVEQAQTKIADIAADLLWEGLPSGQESVAAETGHISEAIQQAMCSHSGQVSLRERLLGLLGCKVAKEDSQEDIDRLLRQALGKGNTTDGTAGH